ncbi:MAG: transposase [Bacillota bacterium]|nr:transposase [Bacillota bacterium]
MERRRIEFPGAFYHVTQRGNNRENIFRKPGDKKYYLKKLSDLKDKFDFRLLGFVLMDNHYHLLLQAGKDPLHKIIFRQNMYYSRYFNRTHNRSGHLYGGRYKAALIQDDRYLFAVLRYIHWNPVRAGICRHPEEYKWSSELFYRRNDSGFVDIDFILNIISANRKTALAGYIAQMKVEEDTDFAKAKYIGDRDFIDEVDPNRNKKKKKRTERKPLDDILWETVIDENDFLLIKTGSRKRRLVPYKKEYIQKAVEQGYSYHEIGQNIKLTASAVGLYR